MGDLPERKRLHHAVPHWVPDRPEFFITINCQQRGKPQLTIPRTAEAILSSVRHLHRTGTWWCSLCLLMPDHLHGIFSFSGEVRMEEVIARFKAYQARMVGICWQDGFFDHRLRCAEESANKADYILNNPIRQGFCRRSKDWPHVFIPDPGIRR